MTVTLLWVNNILLCIIFIHFPHYDHLRDFYFLAAVSGSVLNPIVILSSDTARLYNSSLLKLFEGSIPFSTLAAQIFFLHSNV